MLRSILGVIVGYVAMFAVAFAAYTAAYLGLGAERVFEPGTYVISGLWMCLVIVITLIGGFIGGLVCSAISKSRTAGVVLTVIVFVLSLVFELPVIMKDQTPVARAGEVTSMDVMGNAQSPVWLCLLIPFLSGTAVFIGSRREKSPAV